MKQRKSFPWPDGKRVAVSLSFDDARLTQVDAGIPLLNDFGVRATFYVSFGSLRKRLPKWRRAVEAGHEIGNHSVRHPCSINFGAWAEKKALENYTLAQMDWEMTEASAIIEKLLGVVPKTFAYPCGQKFVGRGRKLRSYVPLVAKRFLAGRGFRDEAANDPFQCDCSQLFGMDFDRLTFSEMKVCVDAARDRGGWLIFAGHEMGKDRHQTVPLASLSRLCRYLTNPANGFWTAPVQDVAHYVTTHPRS